MPREELISPDGLRTDGRRPLEIRKVTCRMGILPRADGSCHLEMGNTIVLATVYGPRELSSRQSSCGIIRCEYSMASFASTDRRRGKRSDRNSVEMASSIKKTFENVLLTDLFPKSRVDIFIQVLQADGSERSAAINAVTIAMVNAGIPMKDLIVSCSAGYMENTTVMDLNHVEMITRGPQLTLAIYASTERMATAHLESKASFEIFENLIAIAKKGCLQMFDVMHSSIERYSLNLIASRDHIATFGSRA
ncbi:Exosome complex component RRP41 [Galdieria sulphuraria]|uniref:Exosome complex component RRP41 n=1 Tax=Galdieria sulphuraria TaxID=130081 RepID=M2XIE0_GALSU|nr:exosome complex component RRP41 [Galdieria sulphuraria]EME29837.1 exosome complex component RRP41 [Galdieria sulphuraria]GJD06826.1 Exosome complex component RRP41 [Galdieria sulphuraria]|eukprot:XP_005706357.1 exosome complex component RRP41 [Galdieria sulphuraria]